MPGLAGLQVEALTAEPMPTSQFRWRPGPGRNVSFNPHGYFVFCRWGDDADCPTYVGKSTNLLGRLGSHSIDKRAQIRRVTLLRCKTARRWTTPRRG